jgi:hypothetical protein
VTNAKNILFNLFISLGGPIFVLFGTFSGMISSAEIVFNTNIPKQHYVYYLWLYFFFLLIIATYAGFSSLKSSIIQSENIIPRDSYSGIVVTSSKEPKQFWVNLLNGWYPLFVKWIMSKNGFLFYDRFSRPSLWETYPADQEEYPIIRLYRKNNISTEIRFPIGKQGQVLVRETELNSNVFGSFKLESLYKWKILFILSPWSYIKKIFK